ncbi:MAG: FMN-binding protein [Eubacteriales bacterium]
MCPEKENNNEEQFVENQLQGSELTDYNPTQPSPSEKTEDKAEDILEEVLSNKDEPEQSPAKQEAKQPKKSDKVMDILAPGLILMAITTVIALMLSVLNFVTKDVINEQLTAKKREAVASIFGDGIDEVLTPYEGEITEPINEINIVTENGKVLGFTVSVSPKGYAGAIEMLVGVNLDNTVKGVRIIEEGETAGVGTKVKDEAFLYQFARLVYEIKANQEENSVDLISGATISSKAVLKGVNLALERTLEIDIGAYVEQETDIMPSEPAQDEVQTQTAAQTEVVTEQSATTQATQEAVQ